jgi:hypothetical protein
MHRGLPTSMHCPSTGKVFPFPQEYDCLPQSQERHNPRRPLEREAQLADLTYSSKGITMCYFAKTKLYLIFSFHILILLLIFAET